MFKEFLRFTARPLPPDAIQLPIETQDKQVAQVIFEKLSVVEFYWLFERENLFEHEVIDLTREDAAGRLHDKPLDLRVIDRSLGDEVRGGDLVNLSPGS